MARSRCCQDFPKAPGGCRTQPPPCLSTSSVTCEGMNIADLCAAPGGKTAQLAFAGASVTAVDRSPARLNRLRENLARLSLSAETVAADALEWQGEPFDAVLLDAPCSSTGTIRRHPDVPWLKSEADLSVLTSLQQRLLDRAVELLKPGATFIYCVCSLEPEEGENQIEALLARDPRIDAQSDCGAGRLRPRRVRHHRRRPADAAAPPARSRPALGRARRLLCCSPHPKTAPSPRFGPAYWPFPDPSLSCGPRVRTGTRSRGRAL